jgi:pentatricopeptide repeat protein
MFMNIKAFLIASLLSSLVWLGSFDLARHAYRDAQRYGFLPNLHIRSLIHDAFDDDDAA